MMIGRECLSLQGFPWSQYDYVDSVSESLLGDLAGNAMSGTCILACVLALVATAARIENPNVEQDELEDLSNLLGNAI